MDARPPPHLILIHIPKTAGTTLSHMLRLHFGMMPANWLRHARTLGFYHLGYARSEHMETRLQRIAALPLHQQAQVRFFAAHAGYGLHERMPQALRGSARYVTVLRDPVARTISTFHHLRRVGRIPPDLNLRNYIDQRKHYGLFKFDNCQVRYLAGESGVAIDSHPHHLTREHLQLAMERLERDLWWFGLTERFDESVLLLADGLGWKRPRYVRARVNAPQAGDGPPEAALVTRIREINALDLELYAHAQRLLDERIQAQGDGFASRVERFQRANARQARLRGPINALLPTARKALQRIGLLR